MKCEYLILNNYLLKGKYDHSTKYGQYLNKRLFSKIDHINKFENNHRYENPRDTVFIFHNDMFFL